LTDNKWKISIFAKNIGS